MNKALLIFGLILLLSISTASAVSWTEITSNAGWAGKDYFGLAVLDNKMWVAGGQDNSFANTNDVWSLTLSNYTPPAPTPPAGTLLSPMGGENYTLGDAIPINYTFYAFGGIGGGYWHYYYSYSLDGGQTWSDWDFIGQGLLNSIWALSDTTTCDGSDYITPPVSGYLIDTGIYTQNTGIFGAPADGHYAILEDNTTHTIIMNTSDYWSPLISNNWSGSSEYARNPPINVSIIAGHTYKIYDPVTGSTAFAGNPNGGSFSDQYGDWIDTKTDNGCAIYMEMLIDPFPFDATGLVSETTHSVRVRIMAGDDSTNSTPSESGNFTIIVPPAVYPTMPAFLNPHDMGIFAGTDSETTSWGKSITNQSAITYDCRITSNGRECGLYPPAQLIYQFQYTNNSGVSWFNTPPYNYSGCPQCPIWSGGSWSNETYFFDPANFPNGNLKLRVRAYDGISYSGWRQSNTFNNCKSYWNCTASNTTSQSNCNQYNDGHFYWDCTNATDISGCGRGNMPADVWLNQGAIHNKQSCCFPDWQCGLFVCQSTYVNCLGAVDANHCGQTYTGDLSEFAGGRCQVSIPYDNSSPWWNTAWNTRNKITFSNPTNETITTMFYPNPNRYTCAYPDFRDMRLVALDNSTGVVFYNTFSAPFNFTQFQIDVPPGFSGLWGYAYCDNPSATYQGASCPLCVDGNYTYANYMNLSWVSEVYNFAPTPYAPQYTANDFALMFIDLIGKGIYVILTFVAVFVVIAIINWGTKKVRGGK